MLIFAGICTCVFLFDVQVTCIYIELSISCMLNCSKNHNFPELVDTPLAQGQTTLQPALLTPQDPQA